MALEEKLKNIPRSAGVYLYKDTSGKIIYIGKAKNLRSRVRTYFQEARPFDRKTDALVRQIVDVEFIVTDSEVEALILGRPSPKNISHATTSISKTISLILILSSPLTNRFRKS